MHKIGVYQLRTSSARLCDIGAIIFWGDHNLVFSLAILEPWTYSCATLPQECAELIRVLSLKRHPF